MTESVGWVAIVLIIGVAIVVALAIRGRRTFSRKVGDVEVGVAKTDASISVAHDAKVGDGRLGDIVGVKVEPISPGRHDIDVLSRAKHMDTKVEDIIGSDEDPNATRGVPSGLSVPVPAPRSSTEPIHKPRTRRAISRGAERKTDKGVLKVWFGTNRKPLHHAGKIVGFSGERDAAIHFGWCRVAIPESHKIGSLGSPWWARLLTLTDHRLRLIKLQALAAHQFWAQLADTLERTAPGGRDAVVFLHGYNVSFEQAALRAAQLGFDLGVSGVMAFYSWPSQGTLHGYTADEATVEASEGFITDYLTTMATRSGAEKVHIIAHSMGNRALARAIDRIATMAADRASVPFSQIVIAAADVDQDTFKRLGVAYQQVAERTTMYVCSKDRAVELSHWLHDFPRAGFVPPVLVVPGIDTINVSNLDLTLLGHGYIAEARALLQDIHRLLADGSPPEKRFGLRRVSTPDGGTYWAVGA